MEWGLVLIMLAVSAVMCCMGFYKFVYFLSIGYGLSVCGLGVTMAIFGLVGATEMSLVSYIFCALFVIYGIRLSGFLLVRELKSISYRKTLAEATATEKPMPVFVKATIWVSVTVLYLMQVSPVYFRSINEPGNEVFAWVGIAISVFGVILEAVADRQKSAQKSENPNMVATKGLYKIVRCPNYFGEILFWTGVFVSGLPIYNGIWQWVIAVFAYVCIVFIMFNGAQRLEKRQNGRYGEMPEYREYVNKTPIIIPLLPIYHLNKEK